MTLAMTIHYLNELIEYHDFSDTDAVDVDVLRNAVNYLQDYRDLIDENGGNE